MPAKACEVCGERTAFYLCQNCGAGVCPVCRVGWFCRNCGSKGDTTGEPQEPVRIGNIPVLFIAVGVMLAGFSLVFIGSNAGPGSGACFVWPLPFVVGCGVGFGAAVPIAALLLLIVFSVVAVSWLFSRRWAGPLPDRS